MHALRNPYKGKDDIFTKSNLRYLDPIKQFKVWFDDAAQCEEVSEPNAMALATSTKNGIPCVRYVLLKDVNENGFQFFTNCLSKKGKHLTENPVASASIYWSPLSRQIRIDGNISLLPPEVADKYFESRPRESQIGALVSERQSSVISSREVLDNRESELIEKYSEQSKIPRPNYWVGYNLRPTSIEFWQGQSSRIHDRILFRIAQEDEIIDEKITQRGEGDWLVERLSP